MHKLMTTMTISRRGLIGSIGALAGTAALPRLSWANAAAAEARFPTVTGLIESYVSKGKLPGMVAALGQGSSAAPLGIARGQPVPHLFDDQADHRHGRDDADR